MKLNIQRFAVTKSTTFAESDVSIEGNTSTLKITIKFSPNNTSTYFSSKTLNCTCNGVKKTASVSLSKGGSVSKTFTFTGIQHNTDGTKSVSWSWSCATGTSVLGTISDSGTRTLETIPQASEIISVSSGTTPYYPVVVWQPKSVDFKFKVEYKAGDYSVISGLISPQQTLQYSYSGLLIANSLFSYFPSTSVVTLRATLYTYKSDGTTEVGRSTYDFNVALDSSVKPNLTIKSLNEANDVMIDLNWKDGNNKPIFVQNRSQLGITYSVYPYPTNLPASNVTTTITANGQTFTQTGYNNSNQIDYTITTEKLNTNTTITATAIDTRSRQDTKTQTYSVVPYSNPSITIAQAQRCRQDGTLDDEGTYVKFSFSGSISSCSNHNDSTFIISYKKTTDEYYTSVNLSTAYSINVSNQISSFTISKDYTYDIKFSAVDSFTTTEIVRTLDTGFDLMNFNESGKAMAIGKVSEAGANEEKLEVALHTTFIPDTDMYSSIEIDSSNRNEASITYYNETKTKGYVAGYGTASFDGFGIYSHETAQNILTINKDGQLNLADDTSWTQLTMESGFQQVSWSPLKVKRKCGIVQIIGMFEITSMTSWVKPIAYLPSGFKPNNEINVVCRNASGGLAIISITNQGIFWLNQDGVGDVSSGTILLTATYIGES